LHAAAADASGIRTGLQTTAWVSRNRSGDARLTNGSSLERHDVAGTARATPCRRQRTPLIDHTVGPTNASRERLHTVLRVLPSLWLFSAPPHRAP
jgi:hypothetical protein